AVAVDPAVLVGERGRVLEPGPGVPDGLLDRAADQAGRQGRRAVLVPHPGRLTLFRTPQRQAGPDRDLVLQQHLVRRPGEVRVGAGRLRARGEPVAEGRVALRTGEQVPLGVSRLDAVQAEAGDVAGVDQLHLAPRVARRQHLAAA